MLAAAAAPAIVKAGSLMRISPQIEVVRGDAAIIDLIAKRMKDAEAQLLNRISRDIYGTASAHFEVEEAASLSSGLISVVRKAFTPALINQIADSNPMIHRLTG